MNCLRFLLLLQTLLERVLFQLMIKSMKTCLSKYLDVSHKLAEQKYYQLQVIIFATKSSCLRRILSNPQFSCI